MDGDDAPGALDAELLEEGGCHDTLVADECVGVEDGAADYGDEDYGEAAAENLGAWMGDVSLELVFLPSVMC